MIRYQQFRDTRPPAKEPPVPCLKWTADHPLAPFSSRFLAGNTAERELVTESGDPSLHRSTSRPSQLRGRVRGRAVHAWQ